MHTISYMLIAYGVAGLVAVWCAFPSTRQFRAIRKAQKRFVGIPAFQFFFAAIHALIFGAAILFIYWLFPDS